MRAVTLAVVTLLIATGQAFAQEVSELPVPTGGNGRSQRSEVSQWIGPVKVSIGYHSPSVGRDGDDRSGHIWGELVRYGFSDEGFGPSHAAPWRAGANETTTISFSHDVRVEGKDLKAGTYGLFVEVEPGGPWTWIFSRAASGWGSYQYDPQDDVLRVPATPRDAPPTEYLTYGFESRREDSAVAFLQWEKKSLPLRIEVPDVNAIYVAEMRQRLLGWPGFKYQDWQEAAQFCADHKINLDEALVWADRAIHEPFRGAALGREDFSTLSTKADVLAALGRSGEADALMDRALQMPGTSMIEVHFYATGLLAAGRKERALAVFQLNQRRHPEEPFWTSLGLARAYGALGEKAKAIAAWEVALRRVPPSQRANVPRFEKSLAALKKGAS
ncbi:MAG TPA: DUF2911 domain-containing protein [Thermoanaerobaculia bacterium]